MSASKPVSLIQGGAITRLTLAFDS